MNKRAAFWLLAFLPLMLFLTTSPAVAQITTGSIQGKIIDEKGEPLPGVLVTARSATTGLERAITTDSRGEYRILGLPPDEYTVQATITGYGAPPKSVVVNIGQTFPLDFTLRPGGGLEEKIEVTAEPALLNTTKTEVSTVVTERQVRSYPLIQRDYNDLAALAPGIKSAPSGQFDPTKKEQIYQPFTTGGTTGRNSNISIDGADNNDNVVGFFVQGFTVEAIQEFEVIQDSYKAEYGRSIGGIVNVLTKSGTNDFGGSVFGYTSPSDWWRAKSYSERLAGEPKTPFDREFFGFSVGGPIVKDKLFYFAALERRNDERPIVLSNLLTSFAGTEPAGFPIQIASPGTVVPARFERDLWTVKFNWNVSPEHLIWVRWSRDNTDSINDQGGELTDPTNQGSSKNDIWSAVLNWQWNTGTKINELKIHRNDFENRIVSSAADPTLSLDYDNFQLGRNGNAPQATFQNKFQIRDDFTWIHGSNTFKAGLEWIRVDLDDSFLGPATTPSIDFVFNTGIDPAGSFVNTDGNGNGFNDGIDVISDLVFVNPGFIPGTKYNQIGAYFQDDWEINERWRLNLGIRYDRDHDIFRDAKKGVNRDFYECFADSSSNAKCGRDPNSPAPPGFSGFENTFPENQNNISPRIGFVYNFKGEDRDVLRGSWGLFYDKLVDNLVIFMRQNLSPFFSPALPVLAGCTPDTGSPGGFDCSNQQLTAGSDPDGSGPVVPLPADFTLANWVDPGSGLQAWFNTLVSTLGPATFNDAVFMPSADWKTPYTSAFSVGWGHRFSPQFTADVNLIYRRGFHQFTRESFRGRNSGRFAPFPSTADPNGVFSFDGIADFFTTDGKSEYRALQVALRGRYTRMDFGANFNIARASGTQDLGGTSPTDGGAIDIFEGGNIRFTGGDINSEWGRVSGDQLFYATVYGIYNFPLDFKVAPRILYGSKTYFHQFAGIDLNGDGFNSTNEYRGPRGGGEGDDLFSIDLRASKTFNTGKGTAVEVYLDVFNLLNRVNHGVFVIHRQLDDFNVANSDFQSPTGGTVTQSRTAQVGLRFTF